MNSFSHQHSMYKGTRLSLSEVTPDVSKIPDLLRSYTSKRKIRNCSSNGDSGVYSSPNSPDIRFVSGHQRSPGAMRGLTRTSLNSSDDTESRKTSHGSFSETIAGLLNLPSEIQDNLTASSITYTRNVVSAEDTFDELLNKMRITSEDSSQHSLPDIRNPRLRLFDGKLSRGFDPRRLGQVNFCDSNNKVTIEGDVVCDNIEFNYNWWRKSVKGTCLIRVQSVLYKVRLEQIKSANSQIVLKDLTFVNTAGVNIKVQGLGPLNWVWNILVIGGIKKSIRMLLTLKLKEQLELSFRKESVIDRLYIPILERKFSRKY